MFLELFFIPGVTILAIAGISLMISGIYVSFAHYGSNAGWLTVAGTFSGVLISLFVAFKSGFWVRLGLKDTQRGAKMNLIDESKIKVGDVGRAQAVAGRGLAGVLPRDRGGRGVLMELTHSQFVIVDSPDSDGCEQAATIGAKDVIHSTTTTVIVEQSSLAWKKAQVVGDKRGSPRGHGIQGLA